MSVDERLDICARALLDILLQVCKYMEFCSSTQSPYQTIFEFQCCLKY